MKDQLTKAVLKTVAYADIFNYPLDKIQLHQFLIEYKIPYQTLQKKTFKDQALDQKDGFYFLKGRQDLIALRKKREIVSNLKITQAKNKAKWLKLIPFIKMVGLTGSLSMNNAKETDDLDFLVVSKSGLVWLTRLLVVLWLDFLKWRRLPGKKYIKNKICLNMFLDEKHLAIPGSEQNLFTAHEVAQLKPLWVKDNLYQKFVKQNLWVKQFLPNWNA